MNHDERKVAILCGIATSFFALEGVYFVHEGGMAMTVYGDVVVAVNTIIDFLLLQLGARLCGYPARPWRCLIAAVLGGIFALLTFLPLPEIFRSFWAQLFCFFCMATLAYGARRRAVRPAVLSFLCGAALAGCVFLLTQLFSIGAVFVQNGIYYPIGSKILILLAGIFYLAAALLAANSLRHGKNEIYSLQIKCGERCMQVSALLDTGNTLIDPAGGKSVIILEAERVGELLTEKRIPQIVRDPVRGFSVLTEQFPQYRFSLLPYRAVGVDGGMLVALFCAAQVGKGKWQQVLVAISPNKVSDGGGYEALIGGTML